MITITPTMLTELGINLSDLDTENFISHIQETLEERVGLAITELLDDAEVTQLMQLTEAGNEAATDQWLSQALPEYKDVIQDEFDILMGEVAQLAGAV